MYLLPIIKRRTKRVRSRFVNKLWAVAGLLDGKLVCLALTQDSFTSDLLNRMQWEQQLQQQQHRYYRYHWRRRRVRQNPRYGATKRFRRKKPNPENPFLPDHQLRLSTVLPLAQFNEEAGIAIWRNTHSLESIFSSLEWLCVFCKIVSTELNVFQKGESLNPWRLPFNRLRYLEFEIWVNFVLWCSHLFLHLNFFLRRRFI